MKQVARCAARVRLRIALAFALGLGGLAVRGAAQEDLGRNLYLKYCSSCHGPAGKGDGIVAQLMTPRPIDLTQLGKKAGGKFPSYDVIRRIDGRETVRAHGTSDMPVWGEVFQVEEDGATGTQPVSRGKSVLIAGYLESIQAK